MKILILGGTGIMGEPLCEKLLRNDYDVHVTSRSYHEKEGVVYHLGNAHDKLFLESIVVNEKYDVIVDFMSYTTVEFSTVYELLLNNTSQYIFTSSARVYAPCDELISESSPRLVDVCGDSEYLSTNEYALSKARQEDMLISSGKANWTIIRPSITYGTSRLQYGLGEKEEWLYRYLCNESIIFAKNLESIKTTMSSGVDVAYAISLLCGNSKALGEVVNIAGANSITWKQVNEIYSQVLYDRFNRFPEFCYVEDWSAVSHFLNRYYQMKYARAVNRQFDNSKLESIVGKVNFSNPDEGLSNCLNLFLDSDMKFKNVSWKTEAYYNRIAKNNRIPVFPFKERLKYLVGRYTPYFDLRNMS